MDGRHPGLSGCGRLQHGCRCVHSALHAGGARRPDTGWRLSVRDAAAAVVSRAGDGRMGRCRRVHSVDALPPLRQAAADQLAADIKRRDLRLSTGFLGTPYLLDVLADTGHADVAIALLLQTGYPSWGYMVTKGATTMWERWNGDVGDVAMNSYNH